MVSLKKVFVIASLALAAVATPAVAFDREPLQVGTDVTFNTVATAGTPRQDLLTYPGASYVAVHFSEFNLPEGDVVTVRSADGSVSYSYTGLGRSQRGKTGGFHATFIPGDTAIVEYMPVSQPEAAGEFGYKIDSFVRGFAHRGHDETICGADNSLPAKCLTNGTEAARLPQAYEKSQTVARLLIAGRSLCTGWLAGSEGHMITNEHCVGSASDADTIDIEMDAESDSCDDKCENQLGCKGKVVATSAEFIINNAKYDYALLKIKEDVSSYGYLQLRGDGPKVYEEIYIPQHPRGWAKRIATVQEYFGQGIIPAYIQSLHATTGCGDNEVGYAADTQGGSSGSPVLSASDNLVVALHHCGGCANTGVDVRDVIADLAKNNIEVKDLIVPSTTPAPTTPAPTTPAPTTPAPTTPAPTTVAPTPAPTPKPHPFCNKFHKRLSCNVWFWCKWDASANVCNARW